MKLHKALLATLITLGSATQVASAATPLEMITSPIETAFGWTPKVLEVLSIGNAKNGQKLAKKHKCGRCHGDEGVSDDDDTPSLAGQTAAYTYKQLADYKNGSRDHRKMKKVAKKLGQKDMADLGAFYAVQKAEAAAGGEEPPLVSKGDRSRLLLACNDCHNEDAKFRKMMEIPATLTGQKPGYFLETMTAFKEGDRSNDLYERMRFIASRLTDEEIEALAKFYSAPPTEDD